MSHLYAPVVSHLYNISVVFGSTCLSGSPNLLCYAAPNRIQFEELPGQSLNEGTCQKSRATQLDWHSWPTNKDVLTYWTDRLTQDWFAVPATPKAPKALSYELGTLCILPRQHCTNVALRLDFSVSFPFSFPYHLCSTIAPSKYEREYIFFQISAWMRRATLVT